MTNFSRNLGRFCQRWIGDFDIPGLAIAITDPDQILWASHHGVADVATQARVTPDTLFEIGSLGKPLTNIVLLQLRDEGKFDLNLPVTQYLPWFQVQSEFPPITAHHLMSQTAGIVQGTDLAPHGLYESWALRATRASAPPGELCWYSNVGYKALGFLVERITGKSFQDAIQSRVLTPLGMTRTHPVITFETRKIAATGYTCYYDDRPEHPSHGLVPAVWSEFGTGDGCQASTATDMTAYLRMLLNRGRVPGGRLISEESFALMTQRVIWTGNDYYGYGLATYPVNGGTLIGHGGKTAGFMSAILIDLEAGLGVVTLANRSGEPDSTLQLAKYALSVVVAGRRRQEIPAIPTTPDPYSVPDAADYAGTYRDGDRVLSIAAEDGKLLLKYDGQQIGIERRGRDIFYVGHPDFQLFLMEFKRDGKKIVEVFHGPHWYINEFYSGPQRFDYPEEWDTYPGHYRARNPQMSNFRVVLRKGALALIYPNGSVDPMNPLGNGTFQIGEDQNLPETLHFDAVVGGQALRADFSGCPYYRTFSP